LAKEVLVVTVRPPFLDTFHVHFSSPMDSGPYNSEAWSRGRCSLNFFYFARSESPFTYAYDLFDTTLSLQRSRLLARFVFTKRVFPPIALPMFFSGLAIPFCFNSFLTPPTPPPSWASRNIAAGLCTVSYFFSSGFRPFLHI